MAEVCGALGDAARAAELYGLLEPYAGRNVVVGRNATCNGSASRLLGLLATAQGRTTGRARTSTTAQEMHASMGARPWHARTQVSYAEMLLARRGAGDVERATEMLADAILVADALGMVVLAERARRLVPARARPERRLRPAETGQSCRCGARPAGGSAGLGCRRGPPDGPWHRSAGAPLGAAPRLRVAARGVALDRRGRLGVRTLDIATTARLARGDFDPRLWARVDH